MSATHSPSDRPRERANTRSTGAIPEPSKGWAEALARLRQRFFVGRETETACFDAFLRHPEQRLLHLFGPGGQGKSALLQQWRERVPGRTLFFSAPDIGTRPDAILSVVEDQQDAVVWFIDGLEHWRLLDGWLRDEFLPRVPDGVRVVTAGRRPLSAEWKCDPGWARLSRELALTGLDTREAEQLLAANRVPVGDIERLIASTEGSPLLLLLSALAEEEGLARLPADPVPSLVRRLVEEADTQEAQDALFLASLVPWTDERLLGTITPSGAALRTLRWLSDLPGFLHSERGVAPHERVREALAAFAAAHVPNRLQALSRTAQRVLVQRVASDQRSMTSMRELSFVLKNEPGAAAFGFSQQDSSYPSTLRPEDHAPLVAACRSFEGDRSAGRLEGWMVRYPDAFVVARSAAGDAMGYLFAPCWDDLYADDLDEPGFRALGAWLEEGLETGTQGVMATRAWLTVDQHTSASAAQGCLASAHWQRTALHDGVLAVSGPDPSPFVDVWNTFADRRGPTFTLPHGRQRWWAHDRRTTSPAAWLERVCGIVRTTSDQMAAEPPSKPLDIARATPSPEDLQPVLRDALRHFHDAPFLAGSPLARWLGVMDRAAPTRARVVRRFIESTIDELGTRGMDAERARVLRVSFVLERKKQIESAADLAMSLGTYRRRLKSALAQLSERAAARLEGPPVSTE
ncbi:MAG: hypothetical protein AB8I08_33940 [Sandaracinaceae bacterium]